MKLRIFPLLLFVVGLFQVASLRGWAASNKELKYQPVKSSYEKIKNVKKGGTLYLDIASNPKVINPILSNDNVSSGMEGFLWATLFTEDGETLNPLPYLAETYTISPDRKSYTFVLNKNAKWEDGSSVTTQDVQFTFDTIMNPKTQAAAQRSYWSGVALKLNDEHSFTFTVETPKFDTLRTLYLLQVIQKKQFEHEADFNQAKGIMNPIGNGPYRLKKFSRDQKVELERNKVWWGNQLPYFKNRYNSDLVVLRVIPDPNLAYERFLKGELDIYTFAGPGLEIYAKKVLGSDKARFANKSGLGKPWTKVVKNNAPRGFTYVGWNLRKNIFSSKKTRQALAHLVDIKDIVEKVYYGYAVQSTSPFGSLTMNSDEKLRASDRLFNFDVKQAIKLLRADGWADQDGDNVVEKEFNGVRVPFRFELKYNSNNAARGKMAQILKENFRKAGIDVSIRSMEWNAFLTDLDKREFDAVVLGWTATPYPNPKQIWHSDSEKDQGSNFIGFKNAKVDELIEVANLEMDLKKRSVTLKEINDILYDEQPYLWLVEPSSMVAGFGTKVKGSVWAMEYDVSPPFDIYWFE